MKLFTQRSKHKHNQQYWRGFSMTVIQC